MEQLARLRRRKGFSQRALAKASGTSPATIYELENGRREANPSTLRKLAGALGVEPEDLYEGSEYPKEEAPSWLELSFNDVIEERRLSRFADAIAAAAEGWTACIANARVDDANIPGTVHAALDLYELIAGRVSREEWDALTSQERRELTEVMDRLARASADGLLCLQKSGYLDEQQEEVIKQRREQMREWTRHISA